MELVRLTDFEHSRKVSKISGILARHAGYAPDTADLIRQAALYHDVGKSGIPSSILKKRGALNEEEYEIVKTHVKIGCDKIREAQRVLAAALLIVEQHHERMNGDGYMGLIGDEIHPYARVVAVADVFDALISRRAYKDPWPLDDVLLYMKELSGIHFDAEIIGLLEEHINEILALYNTKH